MPMRLRRGAIVAVGLLSACAADRPPADSSAGAPSPSAVIGPQLVNDEFEIVKMATADDVLVIEVNATEAIESRALAQRLVEPVRDRFPEVIVYIRWPAVPDRSTVKVSWTAEAGYEELVLDDTDH